MEYVITSREKKDRDLICISPISKSRKTINYSVGIVLNESLNKGKYNIIGEIDGF